MVSVTQCLGLISCCVLLAEGDGAPRKVMEARQACGDRLADIMSLVCTGRGYNVAFRPERSNTRRFRRGIVDECCRKSCSPAMLELYCRADPTERPSIPIRKRSDSEMESSELQPTEEVTKASTVRAETRGKTEEDNKIESKESTTATTSKEGEENFKLLNLLSSTENSKYKHNPRNNANRLTPNDTVEELYRRNSLPTVRHKNHHHSSRQLRGRKASKTKREKSVSGENTQTFQIGTVKPYFVGRALVSYQNTHRHDHRGPVDSS